MPQLRKNIITGDWVVIAPERSKRPNEFLQKIRNHSDRRETKNGAYQIKNNNKSCVFCLNSDNYRHQRIKEFDTEHVYVIPNKYPAFVEDPSRCEPLVYAVENDFFVAKPSLGGHDVVVVKDHSLTLYDFSDQIWRDLFVVFRGRYRYYDKICNAEATTAIYNEQFDAGASIVHPHGQVFAANIIPNLINQELAETERYYRDNGVSAFARLVEHERLFTRRVVSENGDYLAFVQYAARFPFETWIVPKYQSSRFDRVDAAKIASLIPVMRATLDKIAKRLNRPPLNFFIHSVPNTIEEVEYFRWHIEIAPRLSIYGGFEIGSNVVIDTVGPEAAADFLNGRS